MRQVKYLVKEAKENTNTVDAEAISNQLCCRLINRCQDFIMAYLYTNNIKTNILTNQYGLTISPVTDTYDLPTDIYAVNSLSSVQRVDGSGSTVSYSPVRQISQKDRGIKNGYFVLQNQIVFSPYLYNTINILLSYTKKIPTLSFSYGKVASITSTTITLEVGYTSMTDVDDFFSVVDSNGKILVSGLVVNQTLAVLTVPSTTGVTVGSFVVPGKYASTHSQLPDELESSLIFMLEKLIEARLSSSDVQIGTVLSAEQLQQIAEMFSDNSGDSFMPPIVEYTEWA